MIQQNVDIVFEIPDRLNISPEYVTRYRSRATGRMVKAAVAATMRPEEYRAERVTRYRNVGAGYGQRTGTLVKVGKVNALIAELRGARKWR